jgi:CRP-like cAMP-binding protein
MNTETPLQQIEEFFSHYTLLRYDKGERILRENETPAGIFFIQKGIVREYLISEEGNELSTILRPEGNLFPLRWAINNQPNIYNYQTMNKVELWRAPRDTFFEFLEKNPEVLMWITKQVVNDVSTLVYRMQHIVFGNAQAKVASVVLTVAKRFGKKDDSNDQLIVDMPLTHQQIADSAGVTRETASLEMKKLKEKGLITYQGRTIVIMDLPALSKISFL